MHTKLFVSPKIVLHLEQKMTRTRSGGSKLRDPSPSALRSPSSVSARLVDFFGLLPFGRPRFLFDGDAIAGARALGGSIRSV